MSDPVVTSDTVRTLEGIHDRNPVILPGAHVAEHLRIDQVRPFGTKDDGQQLPNPVRA